MAALLKPFQRLSPKCVPNGLLKIDWSHPLATGLIGCWVPGVMFGIDLTGNTPDLVGVPNGAGQLPGTTTCVEGPALQSLSGTLDFGLNGPVTVGGPLTTWTSLTGFWRGLIGRKPELISRPAAFSWTRLAARR